MLLLLTSCTNKREFDSEYYCKKLELNCTRNNQIILFKTSKGDFQVKLNANDYPLTSANFLENVKNGIYVDQSFYKIINFPQVKIIHAGIVHKNKLKNSPLYKRPPYIPLEISFKKKLEPRYNYSIKDPLEIENVKNFFQKGSMAMVKRGEKNSSSTEFFFLTNKMPELDGKYSIFGKIIKGSEVLEKIDKKDLIYEILLSN